MSRVSEDTTILIVDDEERIVELIQAFVANEHDIRVATSADEALQTYDEDVDIVYLDRRLPDRSGDEVLQEIRSREHDCEVVIISAVSEEYNQQQLDYDAYVSKPFTPEDIEQTTSQFLS